MSLEWLVACYGKPSMGANNQRTALAFAAVLALTPDPAEATIARAVKFDEKVEQRRGHRRRHIVSQQSAGTRTGERILTYSKFRVEKTLKGSPAQEITIVTPGGTVGDIAQDYVGVPRFHTGDEHVVFVRNTRPDRRCCIFDQGAYRVEKDSRGERIVHAARLDRGARRHRSAARPWRRRARARCAISKAACANPSAAAKPNRMEHDRAEAARRGVALEPGEAQQAARHPGAPRRDARRPGSS